MEDKPVIASMSNEIVLSIEDVKEEASKRLPKTARGLKPIQPFSLASN
jgi:hypothetical protein